MQRVAERVLDVDDPVVELPQHVQDLRDAARRAASGDPAARRKYEDAVARWAGRIERLGQGRERRPGAHTVRSSTQRLVTELRDAREDQVDSIVDRWVLDRARYQARQIARHETVEAYRDGYRRSTEDNPAVVGYRWQLSPRHPRPDICDLYANQNLYGLGPGGYPPDKLPATPHPNCLCVQTAIVDRFHTRRELARMRGQPEPPREWEVGGHETAAEWLRKQPEKFQRELLGQARHRVFLEDPSRVITADGAPIPVYQVLGIPKRVRGGGPRVSARGLVEADRARMTKPFPVLAPPTPTPPPPAPAPASRTYAPTETLRGIVGLTNGSKSGDAQRALRSLFGDNVDPESINRLAALPEGFRHRSRRVTFFDAERPDLASQMTLSAEIEDAEGEYAGRLARTVTRHPDGRLEVHHDLLVIEEEHQKSGLGSHLLRSQLRSYLEWGVDEVTLETAWAGTYVWARMGFEWDRGDADAKRSELFDFLQDNVPQLSPAEASRIAADVTSDAYETAALDIPGVRIPTQRQSGPTRRQRRTPQEPRVTNEKVGKAFLLSGATSWSGRLDLSPGSRSRARYAEAIGYDDAE